MNILVLGGGTFGTAIANELSVNTENNVVLFSRSQQKVDEINSCHTNKSCFPNKHLTKFLSATSDKNEIKKADVVFIALPSNVIIENLLILQSYFKDDALFVNLSKGLLAGGETFVTRKITMATAAIALGKQECLYLGNLNSQRDWGHAKDYVEAMWRIFKQEVAEDYVIATGVTTYIRDFVRLSFAEVGIELAFEGEDENETATIIACNHPDYQLEIGKVIVRVDPQYYRPTEVDLLIGDPSKSKSLGWKPKYDLAGLVQEMVASDLTLFKKDILLMEAGHTVYVQQE